jgi:hypothetical protein
MRQTCFVFVFGCLSCVFSFVFHMYVSCMCFFVLLCWCALHVFVLSCLSFMFICYCFLLFVYCFCFMQVCRVPCVSGYRIATFGCCKVFFWICCFGYLRLGFCCGRCRGHRQIGIFDFSVDIFSDFFQLSFSIPIRTHDHTTQVCYF